MFLVNLNYSWHFPYYVLMCDWSLISSEVRDRYLNEMCIKLSSTSSASLDVYSWGMSTTRRPPLHIISTFGHPPNLVFMEKCLYSEQLIATTLAPKL